MATGFQVSVNEGVVVVTHAGRLEYADTNNAIRAAADAAIEADTKRVLFDLRRADLSNYYSYAVRHAEFAPELGLDKSYTLAFVGDETSVDVLSFMELVTRNRGWQSRYFVDFEGALAWLGEAGGAH